MARLKNVNDNSVKLAQKVLRGSCCTLSIIYGSFIFIGNHISSIVQCDQLLESVFLPSWGMRPPFFFRGENVSEEGINTKVIPPFNRCLN